MCFYRIFRRSCVLWGPFAFPFFMEDFLKLICLWKNFWESFAWRSFQRYLVFECRLDILPLYSIFPRSSVHDESLKGPAFFKGHFENSLSTECSLFTEDLVVVPCSHRRIFLYFCRTFWSSCGLRRTFEVHLFTDGFLKLICL